MITSKFYPDYACNFPSIFGICILQNKFGSCLYQRIRFNINPYLIHIFEQGEFNPSASFELNEIRYVKYALSVILVDEYNCFQMLGMFL